MLATRAPIDLLPIPSSARVNFDATTRADLILKMHETTKKNIECMNNKYKLAGSQGRKHFVFDPGDLVWLHLRKDRFPDLRTSKLMPRADGPFKVLQKINDNAYKIDLPAEFGVSPTFNIADLTPYLGEDEELPSRTTSIQEGGDDEDISTTVTPTPAVGPMTRARVKQLNGQVLSLLNNYDLTDKNMMLPSSFDLLVLRNEGVGEWKRGAQGIGHGSTGQEEEAMADGDPGTLKLPKRLSRIVANSMEPPGH